jgi:ubiquinone biosynthesis protein
MTPLLFALTGLVNAIILGFVSRRLLGVPVGWPRTILVSLFVSTGLGRAAQEAAISLGVLVDETGELVPGRSPVVAALLLSLVGAWAVAIGLALLVVLEALVPTGSLPGPVALVRGLPARYRRARRYARIMAIATRHGLGGFLRGRSRLPEGEDAPRVARALRLAFTEAGVTFVKLGQMLSTRPDLVGPEFARELGRLTADVEPEPWPAIRRTLTEELGRDPSEVFAEVEEQPLAAASVAQVHRARLADGTRVVLKVQRSGAAAQVRADVDIVRRLARRIERSTAWGRRLRVRALADGFAESLDQELDYRVEAANTHAVAASLRAGRVPVRVPRVYDEWSGPRVLVLEEVVGTPVARAGAVLAGLSPETRAAMARELLGTVLRQVLDTGVFHADLHAGNVVVADDGSLALLDLGAVGRLDSAARAGLARLVLAVDRGDSLAATDALLEVLERPAWTTGRSSGTSAWSSAATGSGRVPGARPVCSASCSPSWSATASGCPRSWRRRSGRWGRSRARCASSTPERTSSPPPARPVVSCSPSGSARNGSRTTCWSRPPGCSRCSSACPGGWTP